ncbi:iron chelate uptake ABC transporter family permease subunit [Plantibacter sp. VKM Ac-2876]|uniref:FecCD family ABC transporter permease n=1 Tax=Plantibacter sp. VKM Ac-2876 TaxID=2783826 RepID=UPI00188A0D3D|nr:iron chelate uptake ABC transporter family permease subunit [Plantibacter sp. VKM Ac-2876]
MSTTREQVTAGRRPARRALLVCAAVVLAIVVAAIAGLALGDYPLTTDEVLGVLSGRVDGLARTVVLDWRLPRVLAAIGFGAALGVSGAVFQTLTRNPLASPDIIGLANGSFTGMLVALLLLGGSWPALMAGSLIGGLAAAVAIFLLALRQGLSGFRFIVVGIGVSAMLAAFNSWLLLRADLDVALFAAAWGAGTLNTATATVVWPALACLVVLFAVLPFAARPLRQLELGDDVAAATGVRLTRERAILIGLAVALVSAVTAVAGPIAFIALAAPQIARRLTRSPGIPLVATGLVGGVLLLASDLVAQHLIPLTVPVGVVTVVVGGLYLTQLLLRERRR